MPNLEDEKSEEDMQIASTTESLEIAGASGSAKVTKKQTSNKNKSGDVTITTATEKDDEAPLPLRRGSTLRLFIPNRPHWQEDE